MLEERRRGWAGVERVCDGRRTWQGCTFTDSLTPPGFCLYPHFSLFIFSLHTSLISFHLFDFLPFVLSFFQGARIAPPLLGKKKKEKKKKKERKGLAAKKAIKVAVAHARIHHGNALYDLTLSRRSRLQRLQVAAMRGVARQLLRRMCVGGEEEGLGWG